MIERQESQTSQHVPFTEIMMHLNTRFGLGIEQKTFDMALYGEISMISSKDASHDLIHYQHLGKDTARLLEMYPDLQEKIDWNAYVAAVSFHDHWKAHLPRTPMHLWIGLHEEHHFAPAPAKKYMKSHGFSPEEIKRVSYLIQIHPHSLSDGRRHALEPKVDERLRLTGRLMYVADTLDLYRKDRIDTMIAHISASSGGLPPALFLKYFARQFEKETRNLSVDLGLEYPWITREAARRRKEALAYIDELVSMKHDVRIPKRRSP